jgi:hypothetical protein
MEAQFNVGSGEACMGGDGSRCHTPATAAPASANACAQARPMPCPAPAAAVPHANCQLRSTIQAVRSVAHPHDVMNFNLCMILQAFTGCTCTRHSCDFESRVARLPTCLPVMSTALPVSLNRCSTVLHW